MEKKMKEKKIKKEVIICSQCKKNTSEKTPFVGRMCKPCFDHFVLGKPDTNEGEENNE